MKKLLAYVTLVTVVLLILTTGSSVYANGAQMNIPVFCYHDIGDPKKNPFSVPKERLREHFTLLKEQGYQPISVDLYLKAKAGLTKLPAKPVILTFDDGYISFYTDIFPLLKEYDYPAVMALVTSWQETVPPRGTGELINWNMVKEMEASGLVTFASHSHDLHKYIPLNQIGDWDQAMSTLLYKNGKYETMDEYRQRIVSDMLQTQAVFEKRLGHKSNIFVWPFGEYNTFSIEAAKAAGFEVFFTLGSDNTSETHKRLGVSRAIVYGNPSNNELLQLLVTGGSDRKMKSGQLDIDMIYDISPAQFESNIQSAIDLMHRSGINTVFLQAFVDNEGSGNIREVYFYTQAAPVKKDVFNHVAQRLHNEGFAVYAWMPTLANQWLINKRPEDEIAAYDKKNQGWYRRATPFSQHVRSELKVLFRDLAAYSPIDGVLFQDDLYMNDFEDFSPAAKAAFKAAFGQELTAEILKDQTVKAKWTKLKTKALNDLTMELMAEVRTFRPQARVARNIYPIVITEPDSMEWMAQNYDDYLKLYDYTIIMAYPYMEKVAEPEKWLEQLVAVALSRPGAEKKTVFKLQAFDWERNQWIPRSTLNNQVRTLKQAGAAHLAYYPLHIFSAKEDKLPF